MASSAPAPSSPAHRARLARWGVACAAGLLVVILVAAVLVSRDRQRYRRGEGIKLASEGRMQDAEALLADALARDPDDVEILQAQAAGYLASHQLSEAERALKRWQALRADDVEPHLALIELSLKQNRLAGAIDASAEVLRLKPRRHDLRQQRANWLFLVGRTEEADQECRRCRDARPDDVALMQLHAEICYRLGDARRTESLVEAVLRQHPDALPALILRGALLLDAGKPTEAIPPLRAAVARGGESEGRARHHLSLALSRTGQEAEARQVLAEAKRKQAMELWVKYGKPDSAAYKVSLAESLLETGKTEEAVQMLEQAVAQSPDCVTAHRLLAKHYESRGQDVRAAEHRRKAGD